MEVERNIPTPEQRLSVVAASERIFAHLAAAEEAIKEAQTRVVTARYEAEIAAIRIDPIDPMDATDVTNGTDGKDATAASDGSSSSQGSRGSPRQIDPAKLRVMLTLTE